MPASQINVDDLTIELRVNGELKQNSSTKEMIWKVPEQVAFLSRYITLEPGDLIFTGCPAGVGFATGSYLNVGDQLEAKISGLGRLSVTIGEPLPH
ncbi:Fumarylpyruvate hydrolase [compost metagenome]